MESGIPQVDHQVLTLDLSDHGLNELESLSGAGSMVDENFDDLENSAVSGRVVILADEEDSNSMPASMDNGCVEPPSKRMYLETVNRDGQTYVLTLHDESGLIQATPISTISLQQEDKFTHDAVQCNPPAENVSDVSQAWFTSREDKTNLHSKGHIWKQGMWSKEEIDLLDANIKQYCIDHSIIDPAEVIFEMTKDERKDFYRTIAKGLNRPLFSVYRRVIRMYDNKNHVGKYTAQEIEKLRNLRIKYGNDWLAIGNQMGRSASSIKDKCRLLKDNCNTGKWFPHEEGRLAEAVYNQSNAVPGEMVNTGISWAAVAQKVGTRSEKQCRTKWLNYLNWKQVGGAEWTREDDVVLVTKMCSLDLSEENQVDWTILASGWNSVRSPQWLRGKWWSLKRHVPGAAQLGFKEVCQYLYTHHVENVHLKGEPSGAESPSSVFQGADGTVGVVTTTAISLPQVRLVQLPISLKTEELGLSEDPTDLKSGIATSATSLQTYEVLQPGLQLAPPNNPPTYFFTPQTTCTSIPYATCTSTSTGQIIIQTVTAEALQSTENVAVHMNLPSQIIITNPDGTGMRSMSQAQSPATIHLTDALHKDHLQSFAQANVLLNGITPDGMDPDEDGDSKGDLDSELAFGTQDIGRTSISTNTPQLTESLEADLDQSELSSHFMLSDPILRGRDDSPLLSSSSDLENEKDNCSDDSLDQVVGVNDG